MIKKTPGEFKKKLLAGKVLPFVAIGFIVVIALWAVITILVPMLKGDGLNNYTGLKRTLAERVLQWENATRYIRVTDLSAKLLQPHIDDVRPTLPDDIAASCSNPDYVSNDPSDPRYYTVVLSTRILGSFTSKTYAIHGCTPYDNSPSSGHPFRTTQSP